MANNHLESDLNLIIRECTCMGITTLTELSLLRVTLRLYGKGMSAEDAIAQAAQMISDSISKIH